MSVSEAYTYIEETSRVTKDKIHYQIDGQNGILVGIIVLTHTHKKNPIEVRSYKICIRSSEPG